MRISGGRARGIELQVPKGDRVRPATDGMRQVRETLQNILYHDDSNVSLEHQVAEINKNQVMHNVAITILSQQFRLLQAAVTERV